MATKQNFMTYTDARALIQTIEPKLKSADEYKSWVKENNMIGTLPIDPSNVYFKTLEWDGWDSYLGIEFRSRVIRGCAKPYMSYEEAHNFIMTHNLKNSTEFFTWVKTSDDVPETLPRSPASYYSESGWNGWKLFLGTAREYISYIDAVKLISQYQGDDKPISCKEYKRWRNSNNLQDVLPSHPEEFYQLTNDWNGWKPFLGTNFIPLDEAMALVQSIGLQSSAEFTEWASSPEFPLNFPKAPLTAYKKEWKSIGGWGGFLNNGSRCMMEIDWDSYEDAKYKVQQAGIKSTKQFREWKDRPLTVPSNPVLYYTDSFLGWDDFFGKIKPMSFDAAKEFVRIHGFNCKREFDNFKRSGKLPPDFPKLPDITYKHDGWNGWQDFLCSYNRWTPDSMLTFIKSLRPVLRNLNPAEQYAILEQGGFLQAVTKFSNSTHITAFIQDLVNATGVFDESTTIDFSNNDTILTQPVDDTIQRITDISDFADSTEFGNLPQLTVSDTISTLELLQSASIKKTSTDEDAVEFLINSRINQLWNNLLNSGDSDIKSEIAILDSYSNNTYDYATTFKTRFLEQYTGATNLVTPEGYNFNKGNGIIEPNLMQKFVAYMLMSKKRFGNWSGTGAGKTLGAILASRTINANLTVIIALNNTLARYDSTGKLTGGWAHEIKTAFPNSNVIIKDKNFSLSTTQPNYLLLNYESFQTLPAIRLVKSLMTNRIDMIVLDEVHRTKKRDKTQESKRRILINTLIKEATNNNPDCHLLAMSATPVINELSEAVSLLEMITNEQYDDLKTKPTIHNALNIHKHLVLNGIRYKPSYETMHVTQTTPPINVDSLQLAKNLKELGKQILPVEKLLLEYKLEEITKHCKPGTIVYSHFVDEIFDILKDHLTNNGFTVGTFNGKDKTGLDLFLNKQVDVLLGSSAIATGVDGLQNVCDKMIIVTLPWTNADFEQLVGRIYRQGSNFKTIEIVIPQLILNTNDISWSWDEQRLGRINYKKTLADSAVDGVIPEGNLMSESELLKESMTALDKWINRIENNDIYSITRDELEIPDMPEDEETIRNRTLTDFSQMNQKINTSNSSTVHQNLLEDPSDFYKYHELYTKARQTWSEIPYKVIAGKLNKRKDWTVADFGCGENLLSKEISNTTYAFDHVAIDDTVTACDMTNTPLKDNQVDVAVFSLSLMSKNWKDYLLEAHRVIKPAGYLFIAETVTHNDNHDYKQAIQDAGFMFCNTTTTSQCGTFVYIDAMKPL